MLGCHETSAPGRHVNKRSTIGKWVARTGDSSTRASHVVYNTILVQKVETYRVCIASYLPVTDVGTLGLLSSL